jgi:hypothetical protein
MTNIFCFYGFWRLLEEEDEEPLRITLDEVD